MENFSELIKNRRSMRKFTDEELTQDEVVALMKAALMSPSSKRSNSWQFVVVDDKENNKKLYQETMKIYRKSFLNFYAGYRYGNKEPDKRNLLPGSY